MSIGNLNVEKLTGKIYPQGDSGTIRIGNVETGAEGSDVEITNSGTRSNAILNFKIPRGNTGATGKGISDIQKTGTSGLVDTYTIYYTDGSTFNFTVTNADAGSAYTKTETNQLLNDKIDKSAISNEINSTVVEGDDTKLASLASIKGFKNLVGNLANLTTTEKASIVLAINELVTSIGTLSNLTTTQKSNIVVAINELVTAISNIDTVKQNSAYYEATVSNNQFTINSKNALATNNTYKVKFPSSNNTSIAQLSVDDGDNYYDINNCTAQAVADEYLTLVFTGTYFELLTDSGTAIIEYVAD
jgi:hypothetical protein